MLVLSWALNHTFLLIFKKQTVVAMYLMIKSKGLTDKHSTTDLIS
jgi:hypothetical protein